MVDAAKADVVVLAVPVEALPSVLGSGWRNDKVQAVAAPAAIAVSAGLVTEALLDAGRFASAFEILEDRQAVADMLASLCQGLSTLRAAGAASGAGMKDQRPVYACSSLTAICPSTA